MRMAVAIAAVAIMVTAGPAEAKPDSDRKKILELAHITAEEQIGRPVKFVVERLKYVGVYAFLLARIQDTHGRTIDYANTKFAREQKIGAISDAYAGLAKRNPRGFWTMIANDVGPTDEVWHEWVEEYGVPPALFKP